MYLHHIHTPNTPLNTLYLIIHALYTPYTLYTPQIPPPPLHGTTWGTWGRYITRKSKPSVKHAGIFATMLRDIVKVNIGETLFTFHPVTLFTLYPKRLPLRTPASLHTTQYDTSLYLILCSLSSSLRPSSLPPSSLLLSLPPPPSILKGGTLRGVLDASARSTLRLDLPSATTQRGPDPMTA